MTGAALFEPFRRMAVPVVAGAAVGVLLLLSGCGGGAASSSNGLAAGAAQAPGAHSVAGQNGAAAAPGSNTGIGAGLARPGRGQPGQEQPGVTSHGKAGSGQARGSGATARMAAAGQDVVFTANMTLRTPDIGRTAARAAQIAGNAGGYVSQENESLRPGHPGGGTATIQLKIPVTVYPATLTELSSLGTQLSLRQQAQDVTQQIADTASQVASDQAALRELRALLAGAGSIGNLLAVQDRINSQESALESMEAQQRALDHEITYATVSLQLVGPVATKHAPKPTPKHKRTHSLIGFVGGLNDGWKALVAVVSWLLSVLGAILPISLAGVLAGYLAYRLLRGRRWLQRQEHHPAAPDSPSS